MSIRAWGTRLGAVAFVGVAGYFVFMSCDVADGLGGDRDDPRLVTAGAVDGHEWAVLQVGEEAFSDCFEFRTDGARRLKLCGTTTGDHRYEVAVTNVRGVTMFVGLLPAEAVQAEVGLQSDSLAFPGRGTSTTAPVDVHKFGESVRYVVGAAPAGAQWREGEHVPLVVTDGGGAHLTP